MFSRESQAKPSFPTGILGGVPTTQHIPPTHQPHIRESGYAHPPSFVISPVFDPPKLSLCMKPTNLP